LPGNSAVTDWAALGAPQARPPYARRDVYHEIYVFYLINQFDTINDFGGYGVADAAAKEQKDERCSENDPMD